MSRTTENDFKKKLSFHQLEEDLVSRFKRAFSRLLAVKPTNASLKSGVMAYITNTAKCAFGAYKTPDVDGFIEHTWQQNRITYLSFDYMNDYMEGALKIKLQNSKNLKDADWFGNKSDPYVVFTSGYSFVSSSTKNNTLNPTWDNECHYLFIRKRHLNPEHGKLLHLEVFDKDTRQTKNKFYHVREKDTSLGCASVDLNQLKKPGVHEMEVTIARRATHPDSTVAFTAEFIPVETALEEMDKGYDSDAWLDGMENLESELQWPELANMTPEGDVQMKPVAFVEAVTTGTQAWILVNSSVNIVVVAFRGTEVGELKDILTDLKFFPRRFTAPMKSTKYAMQPTPALLDNKIRLHKGFRDAYDSIRESILRLVHDITGWHDNWTIVDTGHSLGGALATICAFEMTHRTLNAPVPRANRSLKSFLYHPFKAQVSPQGIRPKVTMLSFGAPRVGTSAFASLYDQTVEMSLRVVNRDDPVTLIPPLYTHTGGEVVVRPAGNVEVSGTSITRPKKEVRRPRGLPAPCKAADKAKAICEEQEEEEEPAGIRVVSHLQPTYFQNIKAAVNQFFHEDASQKGHAHRILRTRELGATHRLRSIFSFGSQKSVTP